MLRQRKPEEDKKVTFDVEVQTLEYEVEEPEPEPKPRTLAVAEVKRPSAFQKMQEHENWPKVIDIVVIGGSMWIVGGSWMYMVTWMFDGMSGKTKFFFLMIWCLLVTIGAAMLILHVKK